MFAQAAGLPVHLGTLFEAVRELLKVYADIGPDDIFIHNDPFTGSSHQADIAVARPMYAGGEFLGLALNRGHWIDVGGMAAGGWGAGSRHTVQEGLRFTWVRLAKAGVLNQELKTIIQANIRKPKESWGDLEAQIAACRAAEARMVEAVDRYGLDAFFGGVDYILSYSKRRLEAAIRTLPEGVYEGTESVEDDGAGNGPFDLTARITIADGRIHVDLAQASPQASGPINCTWYLTRGAVFASLKAVLDPDMPLDSAVMDVITVEGRPGTWVYAHYPAPVFSGTGDPVFHISEAVVQALGDVAPARVPATSFLSGLNVTGSGFDPRNGAEFVWYNYGCGGCGARYDADGNSVLWHLMAPCKNESMEVWERRFPVRYVRFELRANSGGRGQFRGGLGFRKEWTLLTAHTINAVQDSHLTGSRGRCGGGPGAPNALLFCIDGTWGDGRRHFGTISPSKLDNVAVPAGSIVAVCAGGGGGYGDPARRRPESVQQDLEYRYCTSVDEADRA
jgi:N-methylhydantoinase B